MRNFHRNNWKEEKRKTHDLFLLFKGSVIASLLLLICSIPYHAYSQCNIVATDFEFSMIITGVVSDASVIASLGDQGATGTIAVTSSTGKCKGKSRFQDLEGSNQKLIFMTIYNNISVGEIISFEAYNDSGDTVLLPSKLIFLSEKVLGTIDQPLDLSENSDLTHITSLKYQNTEREDFSVYYKQGYFNIVGTADDKPSKMHYQVCDMTGRRISNGVLEGKNDKIFMKIPLPGIYIFHLYSKNKKPYVLKTWVSE